MPKFLANVNLSGNELQNAKVHPLGAAPGSPGAGQIYFNSTAGDKKVYFYDGTAWRGLGALAAASGSPITIAAGSGGGTYELDISLASGSAKGAMSTAHYNLVNGATSANTASTLVQRDASGNFVAGTITASLNANSTNITNVADPTQATHAANKQYVDNARQGLDAKDSVRAATTANGALATAYQNTSVIDGVTLATGDRILIKDQTTASENGIYTVNASGAPTRAVDADSSGEISIGTIVYVHEGTINGATQIVCNAQGATPWVPGTSTSGWTQFSGVSSTTAGAGLVKNGNAFDVVGTANRIVVNADSVDIHSGYVGQTSITTLGTITAGTWTGSTVGAAYGGTGNASYAVGDLLQASASNTLSRLAAVATGNVLISGGVATVSSWGKVGLTTHVSGILPIANGGTNADGTSIGTANKFLVYDGTRVTASAYDQASFATAGHTHATAIQKFAATVGDGTSTTLTVTHNFNTQDVTVSVQDATTREFVYPDAVANGVNTVQVTFATAPATNAYRVIVTG